MRITDILPLFPSWNWRAFGTNVMYLVNSLPKKRKSTDKADFVLCCEVLLDCTSVMQKTNFGLFHYSIINPSSEEWMCARLTQVIFRT